MNTTVVWNKTLEDLRLSLNGADFKAWFPDTEIISIAGDNPTEVTVGTPNVFCTLRLEKKFQIQIKESLEKFIDGPVVVRITTKVATGEDVTMGPIFTSSKSTNKVLDSSGLNNSYTFDSFVVGNNNKFAYQVALTVAEEPGSYNPFFLYSGVGLGKTHLIQAIGNYVAKTFNDKKVLYVTSEQFMNDLLSAIRERTQHSFKKRYRDVDVLLIDDIQFIAGKETTQEEFFNTFNALYMNNKQIVLTSDRPPKDIHHLEDRMRSRFASGMITDMQTPDTETRMAILLEKQTQYGHQLDNEVMQFIAEAVTSNIRELEGAFKQIMIYEKSMGIKATREVAKSQLLLNNAALSNRVINPNDIIKQVCDFYSVTSKDLKGPRRQRHFVIPRQITMYLIKELTNLPYMGIGDLLGGRDHTTIMHGVQSIEQQLNIDTQFKQQITMIREKLVS